MSVGLEDLGRERALFGISVAAELTGVNPQMLRAYEARGLLQPYRTDGGTRRYSGHDLARIERIATLLAGGLNLAGVELVLVLEAEAQRLRGEIAALQAGDDRPARPNRQRRKDEQSP